MRRAALNRPGSRIAALALLQLAAAACALAAPPSSNVASLRSSDLEPIAGIVSAEIEAGRIPGAVVEIGQGEAVLYRGAFGYRELAPRRVAMTPDTIFDLASLTKPVATAVAIMQLSERGRLELDAPAARYWPAFGRNGKDRITLRDLLTHYSGLPADLDLSHEWNGRAAALEMIEAETPRYPPGTHYQYSDINFEVLGEIVRRVSGLALDAYCRTRIFGPLGMDHTAFRPPPAWRDRTAPTLGAGGKLRLGLVHDPTAERMGGVAGHAGLFSTADDLAIFARMLLDGGRSGKSRILAPRSIAEMTAPQSPEGAAHPRGLGWDLAAPMASNRAQLLPVGSYGHTGFTGTMLWISPSAKTYVIVLTNRTYPDGAGDAGPLRNKVLALVSDRLGPVTEAQVVADEPELRPFYRRAKANEARMQAAVATGLDVLEADGFKQLAGARIGLITNRTGVTRTGVWNVNLLTHVSRGPVLTEILTPEHGLYGEAEGSVSSGMEPAMELPIYSLYGSVTRPSDQMVAGVDALVFDVQDVGARFYTYVTTMAYAMEVAARRGIDFYVLDRPNPITANTVQGPVMDPGLKSFTGYFQLPTRYGMTIGELAEMFNRENQIGARLHVIRMSGYRRSDWYDQTGLRWIPPSPNIRTPDEAALYPGVAMVEGANVSVGRGTSTPFELLGAPWIDARKLSSYLESRAIAGVRFEPVEFTPTADRYARQDCRGVKIKLTDREALASPMLGVELISALHRLYPDRFQLEATLGMLGSRRALEQISAGQDPGSIASAWEPALRDFLALRSKYLLY
jgi:uncharacterized protein YbbC (DUF1343 family)/CubicO group peptidase (beta-lactamase class C family)